MIGYDELKINIGKAIRHYRKRKNLSQYELAELTDLSPSYISEIETGKKVPSMDTLLKIADALEIDLWDLLLPYDLPSNVKLAVKQLLKTNDKNIYTVR